MKSRERKIHPDQSHFAFMGDQPHPAPANPLLNHGNQGAIKNPRFNVRVGKINLPVVSIHEITPLCLPHGDGAIEAFERGLTMGITEEDFGYMGIGDDEDPF